MTSLAQEMERKGDEVRKKVSNGGFLASWKPPDLSWVDMGAEEVTRKELPGEEEERRERLPGGERVS